MNPPTLSTKAHVRAVLLTKPFEFLLAGTLFVLGIAMILWPDIVGHAPIGFETRGFIHHYVWHPALVIGSALTLLGLLWRRKKPPAVKLEFAGLLILWSALAENMLAVLIEGGDYDAIPLVLRIVVLSFIVVRCWALLTEPVIYVIRSR